MILRYRHVSAITLAAKDCVADVTLIAKEEVVPSQGDKSGLASEPRWRDPMVSR